MNLGLAALFGNFLQMPLARTYELYELWCFLRLLRAAVQEYGPTGVDLSDLFAAMSIVTDKPFVIGDSIQVDTFSGKVEHIGLKSTRVRSDTGEQIVFGNSDLLKQLLPILAPIVLAYIGKQLTGKSEAPPTQAASGGALNDVLGSILGGIGGNKSLGTVLGNALGSKAGEILGGLLGGKK